MKNNSILSNVKLIHCVFDEISFKRKGITEKAKEDDINVKVSIHQDEKSGYYYVSMTVTVDREGEFDANVKIIGICDVEGDIANLDIILRENVPAILLPYVRAQLTMLTSQPETQPIVLPLINIHNMANSAEKNE